MNKTVITVIVIVLLILLGGGIFYLMKKSASHSSMPAVAPTGMQKTATDNSQTTIQGTLKSLLTGGKSVVCTFSNTANANTVTGTVYASDGKMRGDFKSNSAQAAVAGHMIVDSGYSYIWTDASSQGMKMAISNQTATPPTTNSKTPDLNQNYKFSCQPWAVDSTVFTLPTNITFSSFAIPQGTGVPGGAASNPSTGTSGSNACAACNQIPAGPGRTSCLTQLHCQ